MTAARRCLRRVFRQQGRLTGVVGVLFHRGGQLFHAGRGLFQRGGLFFRTGGKIVAPGGNFACAGVDGVGTAAYGADRGDQRLLHLMQTGRQLAHLIAAREGNILRQVARRNGTNMVHNGLQRF